MTYKIMIVEDDHDIAELLSAHLSKFGFEVYRCEDFSNILSEARWGAIANTGALLSCQPSAPGMGSNPDSILNRFSLLYPHHPAKRGRFFVLACL